ncbi:hypothetical protein ONE63_008061 [Megalurothrips usitatus]|uniref:Uncharacterized protein n=1 Tax=Megalurothrips usitatus TaxID=439358 RepID=A0AAV7XS57_9NEOP|nr:hypothetical protein ONE63_008061 [Megalurothrips usitatus]
MRRFSVQGIVTCLALVGLAGQAEIISQYETECAPLGNGLRARLCFASKLAHMGPEYVKCVATS